MICLPPKPPQPLPTEARSTIAMGSVATTMSLTTGRWKVCASSTPPILRQKMEKWRKTDKYIWTTNLYGPKWPNWKRAFFLCSSKTSPIASYLCCPLLCWLPKPLRAPVKGGKLGGAILPRVQPGKPSAVYYQYQNYIQFFYCLILISCDHKLW